MSSNQRTRPLLIVVSGPSGAGKSTLCTRLLEERPDIVYSVSCTTRPPRGSEADGRDYFFLSRDEFEERAARSEFLEHACVHGEMYGTLRNTVLRAMESGSSVLMDIDIQGARQIRAHVKACGADDVIRKGFVDVFVAPPSFKALRSRLERRAEDGAAEIDRRLHSARREMQSRGEYRYVVANDELDRAYSELRTLVENEEAGEQGSPRAG